MKIAVIGWGSLIWCPGELRISSGWHKNGPDLPVEFSRISNDGRLTLVIAPAAGKVTTLWALSEFGEIGDAAENLRRREKTNPKRIGEVRLNERYHGHVDRQIRDWLERMSLEGAVYTALSPKRPDGSEEAMTEEEAAAYIESLVAESKTKAQKAEEYVRNAPEQIETPVRKRLRRQFGWGNNSLALSLFED